MTANTKIEWADHTFNPWTGCTKVSPGCDHCYAESWAKRSGHVEWGPYKARRRTTESYWQQPRKWNAQAAAEGRRYRVFCASLADVFDNAVLFDWRLELFELIRATPHLDWLLLTKRIGNAAAMIEEVMRHIDIGHAPAFAAWPWPNVWIGSTVVNQEEADRDILKLINTPAAKRFLSIEPMIGRITLTKVKRFPGGACDREYIDAVNGRAWTDYAGMGLKGDKFAYPGVPFSGEGARGIDWVILGGESGHGARPMQPEWVCTVRDDCEAAGVPFFFKQWGHWAPYDRGQVDSRLLVNPTAMSNLRPYGKSVAGRMLDGREYSQVPA